MEKPFTWWQVFSRLMPEINPRLATARKWLIKFFFSEPLVHAYFYHYKKPYQTLLDWVISKKCLCTVGVGLFAAAFFFLAEYLISRNKERFCLLIAGVLCAGAVFVACSSLVPQGQSPGWSILTLILTPALASLWISVRWWIRCQTQAPPEVAEQGETSGSQTSNLRTAMRTAPEPAAGYPTSTAAPKQSQSAVEKGITFIVKGDIIVNNGCGLSWTVERRSTAGLPYSFADPAIRAEACRRMNRAFAENTIRCQADFESAWRNVERQAKEAGIYRESRMPAPFIRLQSEWCRGQMPHEAIALIRRYARPWRVAVSAVSVAPLVVLQRMKTRWDLELVVSYSKATGREVMGLLENACPSFDCLIIASAPFLFDPSAVADEYRLLLPCFNSRQGLYSSRRWLPGRGRLWVLAQNSAHAGARRLKAGKHFLSQELKGHELKLVDTRHQFATQVAHLDCHDLAILWDPIDKAFCDIGDIKSFETNFDHPPICLSLHESLLTRDREQLCKAFLSAFAAEWNFCAANPKEAWESLTNSHEYLNFISHFAGACHRTERPLTEECFISL
jgi:hypothetical protein